MARKKPLFFVAFEKAEKQDDGTMLVSGVASSEAVDSDGEVITADAMKAALPDYMKFGAVREMHQPIAAGTALKCEVGEDGKTLIEAKIVDPVTVLKIEEGVLKGFSIGGKVTGKDPLNKTIITGIRLTEISVVDRPANPEALMTIGKAEGVDETEVSLGALRKSMWSVETFASVLQRIGWMAQDTAWEAEAEGDGSPVPVALRDWLAQGAEIFQAMAKEELEELLATLPAPPTVEVIQMASKLAKGEAVEGLQKKGAKFSSATKAALSEIHKAMQDCCTKMGVLGFDKDDEEEVAGGEDDADKAARTEALQKAAGLEADLQKATDTIALLEKRVKDLEAQPEPPKGVINANAVVSKVQDTGTPADDSELMKQAEEIAKLPPEEQSRLLIKATYAGGVAQR